ncbi:unnamed protein product [Chrysoparadoxa australica]
MGLSCLGSKVDIPEVQKKLFRACKEGDFALAQSCIDDGADINWGYVAWRSQKFDYPIPPCACLLFSVEYGEEGWFAGRFKSSKWLWRTYKVQADGEQWDIPDRLHPRPEVEDGDTLLLIGLKLNLEPLVAWILQQPGLDSSLVNYNERGVMDVARELSREHLLSSRPELLEGKHIKPSQEEAAASGV